jgi:hypothetical protein
MGLKSAEYDADLKSVKKIAKSYLDKVRGPTTFAHSKKTTKFLLLFTFM